jgi:hypothetical protein
VLPLALLVWSERPRWSWRAATAPAALVAATALTLTPWLIRDASVFGQFVPVTTEAGFGLAGTYNPATQARTVDPALWTPPVAELLQVWSAYPNANEAQVSNRLTHISLDYITAHPGSVIKSSYWNLLRLFNLTGPRIERQFAGGEGYSPTLAEVSVYAFWVLLAVALAGAFTTAARRAPKALWGCPAVILLTTMVLLGLTRYRSPADPFFVLLAALGVLSLVSRGRGTLHSRRSAPA